VIARFATNLKKGNVMNCFTFLLTPLILYMKTESRRIYPLEPACQCLVFLMFYELDGSNSNLNTLVKSNVILIIILVIILTTELILCLGIDCK